MCGQSPRFRSPSRSKVVNQAKANRGSSELDGSVRDVTAAPFHPDLQVQHSFTITGRFSR